MLLTVQPGGHVEVDRLRFLSLNQRANTTLECVDAELICNDIDDLDSFGQSDNLSILPWRYAP